MRESILEQKLRAQAKERGVAVYKFESPGQRGVPDDILIYPDGTIHFVELKTDRGSVSELQKYSMRRLNAIGQTCYVLRGERGLEFYWNGELEKWDG